MSKLIEKLLHALKMYNSLKYMTFYKTYLDLIYIFD